MKTNEMRDREWKTYKWDFTAAHTMSCHVR